MESSKTFTHSNNVNCINEMYNKSFGNRFDHNLPNVNWLTFCKRKEGGGGGESSPNQRFCGSNGERERRLLVCIAKVAWIVMIATSAKVILKRGNMNRKWTWPVCAHKKNATSEQLIHSNRRAQKQITWNNTSSIGIVWNSRPNGVWSWRLWNRAHRWWSFECCCY